MKNSITKAQSTEHRAQSTEHRAQSTEQFSKELCIINHPFFIIYSQGATAFWSCNNN